MAGSEFNTQVAVVLSGGGARGFAHIGVLKALNDNGIFPAEISGTSMGAIIGMLYASGMEPGDIVSQIEKLNIYKLLTSFGKVRKRSLKVLYPIIRKAMGINTFEQLKIPLYIAVTNVNRGAPEMITRGDCIHAALASASIPFVFRSYSNRGMSYVDGGLMNNFPADPFLDTSYRIIGCDVNYLSPKENVNRLMTYVERIVRMALFQNVRIRERYCDYLLEPDVLSEYSSFDFKNLRKLFEMGESYTNSRMDEIKKALSGPEPDTDRRKNLYRILKEDHITLTGEF